MIGSYFGIVIAFIFIMTLYESLQHAATGVGVNAIFGSNSPCWVRFNTDLAGLNNFAPINRRQLSPPRETTCIVSGVSFPALLKCFSVTSLL